MFDWQTITVTLIILAALAYVARRALARLSAFRLSRQQGAAPACATGCGSCGESKPKTTNAPAFINIVPAPRATRRNVS